MAKPYEREIELNDFTVNLKVTIRVTPSRPSSDRLQPDDPIDWDYKDIEINGVSSSDSAKFIAQLEGDIDEYLTNNPEKLE